MPTRQWRHTAAALAALPALLATLAGPAAAAVRLPEPSVPPIARAELNLLTVAEPRSTAGYSRDRFPHWSTRAAACDARETVLARDGQNVQRDDACRAVSGSWYSAYDGRTLSSADDVDVSHIVPLANAWRSGADTWTDAERESFANDLERPQLLAVSAASNRSRGDQGPESWKPPLAASRCMYARAWADVKYHYRLTVTAEEKAALAEMLDTCRPQPAGEDRKRAT
ncbi:HNH endonuclease family protein [Streptosporangium sp. OZ121]|uniref:HNH endonuclease family protein n=1 Tax=Streptosporangium sp. OZ121 TaxID=3444183 RepID=UPI003F7A8B36